MNHCEEIYPGIFKVVQIKPRRIAPPVNIYIIAGDEGLIFDAGYGDGASIRLMGEIIDCVQKKNKKWHISRVLPSHTHPDHFSGLKQLKNQYGIAIMLTEPMAMVLANKHAYRNSYRLSTLQQHRYSTVYQQMSELPLQLLFRTMYKKVYGIAFLQSHDITVKPGEIISINGYSFTILHGPGHCNDHIMLYDKKEGILFAGDNILRSIYTWLGPPRSNLKAYLDTLNSCLNLPNLALILSAHGSPITNPKQRIHEIIEYRKLRTRQVFSLVANADSKGITFQKLLDVLYPRRSLHRWLAKGWVIVTLEYLLQNNAITFQGRKMRAVSYSLTFE
ncbi:MAG: MBL fold metallo-hydrolase [Spirochaetota bacterium]